MLLVSAPSTGRNGLHASAGCEVVIAHAFKVLELNRVMANYMPANQRSGLLSCKSCGFAEEGYAKKYLKINGRWEESYINGVGTIRWLFSIATVGDGVAETSLPATLAELLRDRNSRTHNKTV